MPLSRNRRDALAEALYRLVDAFIEAAIEAGADPIATAVIERLDGGVMRAGVPRTVEPEPAALFLTQRAAADYTGRSVSSIRRARAAGLPFAKVGGSVVFTREVLDRWMTGLAPLDSEGPGVARGPPWGRKCHRSNPPMRAAYRPPNYPQRRQLAASTPLCRFPT